MEPYTVTGIIKSLQDKGEAEIIGKFGSNKYIAVYNGVHCTAIQNFFNGYYYIDNEYGCVTPEMAQAMIANYEKSLQLPPPGRAKKPTQHER